MNVMTSSLNDYCFQLIGQCLSKAWLARYVCAVVLCMLGFQAAALQQFETADNSRIDAVISSTEVNRISVIDDKIRSVVGVPPQGWSMEHDRVTGDLFLIPLTADTQPLSLFIQTQNEASYQLELQVDGVTAQQILIRNSAIRRDDATATALWQSQPRVVLLTQIVQALRQNNLSTTLFSRRKPRADDNLALNSAILDAVIMDVWESEYFIAYQLHLTGAESLRADKLMHNSAAAWISEADAGGISQAIIILRIVMAEDTNQGFKRRQRLILAFAATVIGGVFFLVVSQQFGPLPTDQTQTSQRNVIHLSRIDDLAPEDTWVELAEGRIRNLEDEVEATLERNAELKLENEALLLAQQVFLAETQQAFEIQRSLIEEQVASQLEQIGSAPASPRALSPSHQPSQLVHFSLDTASSPASFADDVEDARAQQRQRQLAIRQNRYLPAGAYAPAVITAGVAANVSASGSGTARPVVMRITGKAKSASSATGKLYEVDVRGCTVTGEANGDLSSERVYIRLLVMTCREGDQVTETTVRGFVAGAGQTGVRGPVIRREGDLIAKSFLPLALSLVLGMCCPKL